MIAAARVFSGPGETACTRMRCRLNDAVRRAPISEQVDIMEIGFACAFLATPYALHMTGSTPFVDGGVNTMA